MSTPDEIAAELLATMEENNRPKPGVYKSIPESIYHGRWRAVGSTLLAHMQRSPAHAKWALDNPQAGDTPAKILGRAIHVAVLEPDTFLARYAQCPDVDLRTKFGKDLYAATVTANPGRIILRHEEWARCMGTRDAVNRNTFAMAMLHGAGEFELSMAWDDVVRCKGRLDRISFKIAGGTIVDLKSTRDARREAFERAIFNYRYFGQSAHYLNGAQANHLAVRHYTIIACESEPPFGVGVYRMQPEVITMGEKENEQLLRQFEQCERSGNWPAYEDGVNDIGIPEWGWRQLEERIEP